MSRSTSFPHNKDSALGWDSQMQSVAQALPAVLDGLRSSYRELEERAARVERELAESNRKRGELEERLHAADKLSALGTMAAGIAHEIRNPLNAVRGFAELLAKRQSEDERACRWSRLIVEGVQEADAIICNLLSFGSPERLLLETIAGQELLEEARRLAVAHFDRGDSTPEIHVQSRAPDFYGDRIKLRQAIRNLIENALEAQAQSAAPRVQVELVLEGTDLACLVADAGPGVAADLRSKILDPFFTTHAEGTGLGLALVSVIARLHGGSVLCAPHPSALGGALFVLQVPFQPADRPAVLPKTSPQ